MLNWRQGCASQRNIKVWNGSLASSMWDTGSLLGLLQTPGIFPNGQLFLWPSLLTIQGWMPGIVGFSLVCGVLLEHAQMKSDARRAKSADHTDLIHRGCWVLVSSMIPLWSCSLDSPKHYKMTIQISTTEFSNTKQVCLSCESSVDDVQERWTTSFCQFGLSKCEKKPRLWKTCSLQPKKTHSQGKKPRQATWKILLTRRVLTPYLNSHRKQ